MTVQGFTLVEEQEINELNSRARLYRHDKTGAQILSMENDDENKVFGIAFRTPPRDSTGVAHILEHSVLCGSRKYPSKEPFVELLKGSLQTFLNAMTFPDKTCYPVASQNEQDFYNLIDVYLDAVFFPRINRFIFQQEGWHYEFDQKNEEMTYKGVVFNEMKGAYSSPDSMIAEYSQQSLFPDTTYGFDSGGHPETIPDLTYEDFIGFHRRFYHPSNARIFFYGDDNPEARLEKLTEYLDQFEAIEPDSSIELQEQSTKPWKVTRTYQVSKEEQDPRGMVTVNWLLGQTLDREYNLKMQILDYILVGMPASPLRKALIDSGLGEDLAGHGLEPELLQMYFSAGLKGVKPSDMDKVEKLILQTMERIAADGLDPRTVRAGINTIEFRLRENNAGPYPRGLLVMLRALSTWLYDGDPFALLAFEEPLAKIKTQVEGGENLFEELIRQSFLENGHRSTVLLKPDTKYREQMERKERERIAQERKKLSEKEFTKVVSDIQTLHTMQETPDSPEVLAAIPQLGREDLDRENKVIPLDVLEKDEFGFLYHDIPTNGICYMDLGFDLRFVPQQKLPYVPLFGRALLGMGTDREDFVSLTQRIRSETGGINASVFATGSLQGGGQTWLMLRGKAVVEKQEELLSIFEDVLVRARLDDRDRFRQLLLEEKASQERSLIPAGHSMVDSRLRARFTEPDWISENLGGINYLFFLRYLIGQVESDWESVSQTLEGLRKALIDRKAMMLNVTMDGGSFASREEQFHRFASRLPQGQGGVHGWTRECLEGSEGMTIPAHVNYVGKGFNLFDNGYAFKGTGLVASRYLRTSWLWEQIRVKGGAYGAFCNFDRPTGVMTFVSYRDPNVAGTLDVFDRSAQFLQEASLEEGELTKAVVGAIGLLDKYMFPDAKGYASMIRYLTGDTEEVRQRMREEVLATTKQDFRDFAGYLAALKEQGVVSILGSEENIDKAKQEGIRLDHVFQVL